MSSPIESPPADLDSEGVILSSAMLEKGSLEEVDGFLRAEHFYSDANRRIWECVTSLASRGQPTDPATVAGWLRDHKRLDQVGGTPYIAQLVEATPPTVRLAAHAMRIIDKWRLRRVIEEARNIIAEAYAVADDVPTFVQQAEARIFSVSQDVGRLSTLHVVREVMSECVSEATAQRRGDTPRGVNTGFKALDKRIGGLRNGRVYVIAGRPGSGKTSAATKMMRSLAKSDAERKGVYLASVEMPSKQIGDRLIAQEAQLDTRCVEMGVMGKSQWGQYTDASNEIAKWPMVIDDQAGITLSGLRSSLRRAVRKLSALRTELGLVVIDYLQLMGTGDLGRSLDENARLTLLSAGILGVAKEFNVPVVLLSQLNRDCEKRPDKRPMLSDLRGSGSIEQDAHTIIFAFREDLYRKPGEEKDRSAELIVAKCRGGRVGTVKVGYLDYCTEFVDVEEEDPADEFSQMFDEWATAAGADDYAQPYGDSF